MNAAALAQKVAEHLARRPCRIVYRAMAGYGFIGLCSKDAAGLITISLDENLSDDHLFRTLLHEVAHARLQYDTLSVSSFDSVEKARKEVRGAKPLEKKTRLDLIVDAIYNEREEQADAFENELYNFAASHADDFEGRCKAILSLVEYGDGRLKPSWYRV